MENKFLVGNILREVKNGRINCNNAKNEQQKMGTDNATYVKKIRRQVPGMEYMQVHPYASAQSQKKIVKEFAKNQGFNISYVKSASSTEASSEGDPYKNYDEDIMGFMNAKAITITEDEFNKLDEKQKIGFSKQGKKGYKKDITKKRRAKLMMSTLQAIGHTKISQEFCTRQTDDTPILYSKEVYSADMSSTFILDINSIGKFNANDNKADYRDYNLQEAETLHNIAIEDKQAEFSIDREERLNRINITLDALRAMDSKVTMTNNLEDLSAKFVILAEYSIGSSIFSGIFGENKFKVDYLKQAIDENEEYRLSKIYIGCREEHFERDGIYLANTIRVNFGDDERFVISGVKEALDSYKEYLEENLE